MLEHDSEVERGGTGTLLRIRGAGARFVTQRAQARIDLSASNLKDLYFNRTEVVSHIMEFASETAPVIIWRGDGGDLECPPNFRKLEVQSICDITPHMRRITFHCEDAVWYASLDASHVTS